MGRTVADRYVDFLNLSSGSIVLRVSSPIAAHALREMESIFRQTLEEIAGVTQELSDDDIAKQEKAAEALRALNYDADTIKRSVGTLQPSDSHKLAIKKIASWLGFTEASEITKSWLAISGAAKKAHERKFNRNLIVDDEFREKWANPFDRVIRGVAIALQTKFVALINRAGSLAQMDDAGAALTHFVRQNVAAMAVQWHFYRSIEGPRWLPELISRGLVAEPLPRPLDDDSRLSYREWPLGDYLIRIAKGEDKNARSLLAGVVQNLAESRHPDVMRDGLQILTNLPADESAALADVAVGWLDSRALQFGIDEAEKLIAKLALGNESEACKKIATSLLQLFDHDEKVGSLFPSHMYEYFLPKIEASITPALRLDALRLLTDLLYKAGIISGKMRIDPWEDYTSVTSGPLPEGDSASYDIYGALSGVVRQCAVRLLSYDDTDVRAVMAILLEHKFKIFQRIAFKVLAIKPSAAPDIADKLLFDSAFLESHSLRHEYAELALAHFPALPQQKQVELLELVDAIPDKFLKNFKERVIAREGRGVTDLELENYAAAVIRDATWYWREALPMERQTALAATVVKIGEPDAWKANFDFSEKSPFAADDFAAASVSDIANYLQTWAPDESSTNETKAALGAELRTAIQGDPQKFSASANSFAHISPFYMRRFFEGLTFSVQNGASIDWEPVLKLILEIFSRVTAPASGESSWDVDEKSWFWAAKDAAELVRSGLNRGNQGIPLQCDADIRSIITAIDIAVPLEPDQDNFELHFQHNAYFASNSTMLGLTVELCMLRVFWLSKLIGSQTYDQPRDSVSLLPEFTEVVSRLLAHAGTKGRVVRAVLGRYLNWLGYFGEEWTKTNFELIFPAEPELSNAAWVGHLLSDSYPAKSFMSKMVPLYRREITRLKDTSLSADSLDREDRLCDFLLVLRLWGSLPTGLLEEFLEAASVRLRRHAMWFVGSEMRSSRDMPPDIRKRGEEYWEMRLSAAELSENKEHFREELGTIGSWAGEGFIPPDWLIAQLLRMLKSGFAPEHSFSVVEWAAKLSSDRPGDAVEIIEALLSSPHAEHPRYMLDPASMRTILQAGNATSDTKTQDRVKSIVSILASKGDISFLDLSEILPVSVLPEG